MSNKATHMSASTEHLHAEDPTEAVTKSIPVVTLTALTCAEATHTELEVGGVYYGEVKRENGQVLSARLYDMATLYQLAGLVGTMRDSKTAEQVFHQLIWMNEHRED